MSVCGEETKKGTGGGQTRLGWTNIRRGTDVEDVVRNIAMFR